MRIIDVCMNRAEISSTRKVESISTSRVDRAEILTKMDGRSVLLGLQSVITMLTAQRSAGSHQPSISDIILCQLMAYLQKRDSHSVAQARY